jgi:hypothetical protein
MLDYRVYLLNQQGRVDEVPRLIRCASDEDGTRRARQFQQHQTLRFGKKPGSSSGFHRPNKNRPSWRRPHAAALSSLSAPRDDLQTAVRQRPVQPFASSHGARIGAPRPLSGSPASVRITGIAAAIEHNLLIDDVEVIIIVNSVRLDPKELAGINSLTAR